jgi:hypothetical protein
MRRADDRNHVATCWLDREEVGRLIEAVEEE